VELGTWHRRSVDSSSYLAWDSFAPIHLVVCAPMQPVFFQSQEASILLYVHGEKCGTWVGVSWGQRELEWRIPRYFTYDDRENTGSQVELRTILIVCAVPLRVKWMSNFISLILRCCLRKPGHLKSQIYDLREVFCGVNLVLSLLIVNTRPRVLLY
jgi:hypothetical protein